MIADRAFARYTLPPRVYAIVSMSDFSADPSCCTQTAVEFNLMRAGEPPRSSASKRHGAARDALERIRPGDGVREQGLDDHPRKAAVAVRKHLLARRIRERVEHVRRVGGERRQRVGPKTKAAALVREVRPHGLAADAVPIHQVVFKGEGVQLTRDRIAVVHRPLKSGTHVAA